MEPLVSVILPVYNQEKFVADTIESVLAQSYKNFELVIVDDGSKDKSREIIKGYASADKRIVPVLIENVGKPKAIDAAVAKSKGKFLAFIDHDDLMVPTRLEKQLEYHHNHKDIHATSSHSYYIDEKNVVIGKQQYANLKTKEDCQLARERNQIVICAFSGLMVYKSAFLDVGGLRTRFWPCDDGDFLNRLIENGYNIIILQEFLMRYRIHQSQYSSKNDKFFDMAAYANYCGILRKEGKEEISFAEFKAITDKDSWWFRFKRKMHHLALVYHQKAGFAYYTKKYPAFVYLFSVAFLLSPAYVYTSVAKRFR